MQKARPLLGCCTLAWKSVRMASSGVARQSPLANKVALVTASTDGIGFAIARRLAEDGAHVVISSRKQQNVDRAVATLKGEGLSVTGTVCHVGNAEDRERLVTMAVNLHGGIDILVSNAAVNPFFGNLMDVTEEVWDKVLNINVKATAMLTKAVVPEMEKRGGGSVVIVSSIAAFTPLPALGPYNVSKTALLGLTKNLALELASKNIRVNCLAPGLIRTRFSSMLWMDKAREDNIKEIMHIRRHSLQLLHLEPSRINEYVFTGPSIPDALKFSHSHAEVRMSCRHSSQLIHKSGCCLPSAVNDLAPSRGAL